MGGFEPSNLASPLFIFKFIELIFGFIILILYTCGPSYDLGSGVSLEWTATWGTSIAEERLGIFTCIGYFFITLVLMIGIVLGDKARFQLFLFNAAGFFCYIIAGSYCIQAYNDDQLSVAIPFPSKWKSQGLSMGSMAIINSVVFLVDTLFSALAIRNNDD